MGFGPLRVINEDKVVPAAGFDTHGHRDMEIISYVLAGELAHKDSIGTGSVIRPGDVQRMTAGTGIQHSEFNNSDQEPVHFLQIWIEPEQPGLVPGYEQKTFDPASLQNQWRVVVNPTGTDGALKVHQDVRLLVSKPEAGKKLMFTVADKRTAWVQVARGAVTINELALVQGDGLAISAPGQVNFHAGAQSPADAMAAANQQTAALARLLVIVEQYPNLKANEQFNRLSDELAGTENRIAVERMRYNERVQEYNTSRRQFPGVITAKMFSFQDYPLFEAPPAAQQVPKVGF
jgi:redox-sensitive bicupin YhaK (pirin superfamily)